MTGYPVILGGDHAEFEQEWAASGRPDHERPDWPLPSFDAVDWAKAFVDVYPMMDEATAVAWFAAALMRGYDERDGQTAAPEWLPIESAPRDGTPVDLWCCPPAGMLSTGPGRVTDCHWWQDQWQRTDDDGENTVIHNATHYMLLLAPPKAP